MPVKNNVISFDFDGTLSDHFNGEENPHQYETRDLLKRLMRRGYDVYIITRRFGPDNSARGIMDEHLKVWEVADELGVPREKIIFTAREWKYTAIESVGACMHIDDDAEEMRWLEEKLPQVNRIWLGNQYWKQFFFSVIDKHDHVSIWFSNEDNVVWTGLAVAIIMLSILLFL